MTKTSCNGIINLLLTVTEDREMLRSNPSAGTEVSGKSDAGSIALFLCQRPGADQITLSGNLKAVNLRGPGTGPRKTYNFSI